LPSLDYEDRSNELKNSSNYLSDLELAFNIIDIFALTFFSIEFTIRFICCPFKFKFIKLFHNWIDFLTIFPFIILFILPEDTPLAVKNIFRMLRILILLKITRFSSSLQSLKETIKESTKELFFLLLYLVIIIVFFSVIVFYCEYLYNPQFSSIPQTFWWAIATITSKLSLLLLF
jgi:hypothetical protein